MKIKTSHIVLLFLFLTPTFATAQKVEKYYDNGQLRTLGYLNEKTGKQEGHWITYSRNGLKTSEGYYKDGKKEGIYLEYDEYERVYLSITYKNDLMHGPFRQYHMPSNPKGKPTIYASVTYRFNQPHGMQYIYDERGKITNKRRYDNGLQETDTIMAYEGVYCKQWQRIPDSTSYIGYRVKLIEEFHPYPPKQRVNKLQVRTNKSKQSTRTPRKKSPSPSQSTTPKQKLKLKINDKGVIEYK